MNRRWARRGIIGALLLAGIAFLVAFIRLDDAALHAQLVAQLEQATGRTVHGGKVRLSLQQGISLKINRLKLDGPGGDWELEADVVRFDIALGALLLGELRVSGVDMVHPVLRLNRAAPAAEMFSGPLVARLMRETPLLSFRQGRIVLHDRVLVDEVAATLRRIDREQRITWEVQSRYAGGDFSTQGYIRAESSGGEIIFGRISATQLQLAELAALPLPSLHYDMLDASLTFSLDATGQWQWFGNLLTRDAHAELPELSWRGKLIGSSVDDFRLHDAFVQFGEKTRLVVLGGCGAGHACSLQIETRAANPGLILKAGGMDVPLQGKLDGKMELSEQGDGWNLNGRLGLRSMTWGKTSLPDTQIELSELHMQSPQSFQLRYARIQPGDADRGSIELSGLEQHGDTFSGSAQLNGLQDIWVSLTDLLLQQSGIAQPYTNQDRFSGAGVISGSLDWLVDGRDARMRFSLHADDAAIGFGKSFAKPAGVAASMQGSWLRKADRLRIEVGELQLGNSRLSKLELAFSDASPQLSVAHALLDMDRLKAQGVVLPGSPGGWQGALNGGLEHVAPATGPDLLHWLAEADGHLELSRFGSEGQVFSGSLDLQKGRLKAGNLNWQRGTDFADFSADLDLASLHGSVNIARAGFKWSPESSLAEWLAGADILGRFRQTDVLWNGNVWKGMQGGFVARDAVLQLDHVRGRIGEGKVQSRNMDIRAVPGGTHFSGQVGMSAVRLNDLQGLADATGATMHGYVFANARLDGALPLGIAAWSGNGDIEIHRGLWKEARAAHHIQWLNDAAAKLGDGDRFDRLNVRFRFTDESLQLRRLVFSRDKITAKGEASISAGGEVSGGLDVQQQGGISLQTGLAGRWPSLSGFFLSSAGH